MTTSQSAQTRYLHRPEGQLAYDDQGDGPLIVCLPGMGDIRSTYRYQRPELTQAGFRVITMDLRGHGDSDATFTRHDDEAAASDLVALLEELGGPAVLVGNSMGAGAAVLAAAQRPDLVSGLVLVGPFVRNPAVNPVMTALMRVLMAPAWARWVWTRYVPTLYAGTKPPDFTAHVAQLGQSLKGPGRARAFSQTTRTSHAPAEEALPQVSAPVLVVMGRLDPDWKDPAAEAQWVAEATRGEVVMVHDAGHYPHAQQPEVVNAAVLSFLDRHRLHA